MNFSSRLIEDAVEQFASLPGIGKRTALRLVLHLLKQNNQDVERFGNTFIRLRNEIKYCKSCHNISETDNCEICTSSRRDRETICVVEDIRDVMAVENTGQFTGIYHVLGGIISPMDGIGPGDLNIESLVSKAAESNVKEVVLALSTTMEGDTTNFYIYKRLKDCDVKISQIARGIAFGGEIEYADELTLGRSIQNRVPYENNLSFK